MLTSKGTPTAVLLSAKSFDAWNETLATVCDIPDLDEDIAEVKKLLSKKFHPTFTTLSTIKKTYGLHAPSDAQILVIRIAHRQDAYHP